MIPQPARAAPDPARRLPPRRALSLERKLPLLMTAVLVVVLALSLFLTYGTLVRSEETSVHDRLTRAARQVASTVEAAVSQRKAWLREVASDAVLRRALARVRDGVAAPGSGSDSAGEIALARDALARFRSPADSGLALELWDADARRLTYLGPDVPPTERAAAPRPESVADSVSVGPMYASAGRVVWWTVAPVVENGRRIGYVANQRRVTGPREAPQSLRELLGEAVTLYMRNAGGTFWASAPGAPAPPPARRDSTEEGIFDVRPGVGRTIVAEAAIGGAPWVVVLESPVRSVRARARATLLTLALLSLMLTAVGAALSWAISRRVTRPLASLTTAAEAIARGEYGRRVESVGGDEIGRLSASFNQMATEVAASRGELERRVAEAEQANRAKSDFLAVMSHELRTPLNAIGGYAQLIELGLYGPVTDAQRNALSRLARSQAQLLRLINDVLNFAKIDSGQVDYTITDVPLGEALADLEPLIEPQVRSKGLSFTYRSCDPLLTVRADRERLQQIVLNLITNAIKFTPAGGSVAVDCDAVADSVRLRVRDSGVGIPAERLPYIFDPFVQGHRALNRPNDGVGLGLAISRDLARAMHGDIVVESVVGRGSVVTLRLPRPAAVPAPGEYASREKQAV